MRLAPVAIFFRNDLAAATEAAAKQSLTTHAGVEAAEACRLLAHILVLAMRSSAAAQSAKDFPAGFQRVARERRVTTNTAAKSASQATRARERADGATALKPKRALTTAAVHA